MLCVITLDLLITGYASVVNLDVFGSSDHSMFETFTDAHRCYC